MKVFNSFVTSDRFSVLFIFSLFSLTHLSRICFLYTMLRKINAATGQWCKCSSDARSICDQSQSERLLLFSPKNIFNADITFNLKKGVSFN